MEKDQFEILVHNSPYSYSFIQEPGEKIEELEKNNSIESFIIEKHKALFPLMIEENDNI